MRLHRLVETFDDKASRCRRLSDLSSLMDDVVPELGFQRFAIVQGLWFRMPEARLIRLDNYGDYGEEFIARKDYLHDPVMRAGARASKVFPWRQLARLTQLGPRQQTILDEAERQGLRNGLTLPFGALGEPAGTCSFATAATELPSTWHCRAATLIGATACHEARRLCGFPARSAELPEISPRKLEILQLAATGRTDPEIAMLLDLRRSTIETYMTQLRQALDVGTRTQLCIHALRIGLIAFEDAISGF